MTIADCCVYDSQFGIRAEDKIENFKVNRLGIGSGPQRKFQAAGGGTGSGYEYTGEFTPPAFDEVMKSGRIGK